jgi:hypothetical protein
MYAEVWKGGFQSLALAADPAPVTFKFLVNIASDQPPTTDITVTLAVNDSARTKYNRLNGTSYKLFPYITILTPTVVIKAGTRNAYAYAQVSNANLLNACDQFMAPISIVDATGGVLISDAVSNGSRLMSLPISNPWAADYDVVGYRIRPGNPTEFIGGVSGTHVTQTYSTVSCKAVSKVGFGNYTTFSINIEVLTTTMVVNGVTCFKINAIPYDPTTGLSTGYMWTTWQGDAAGLPAPPTNNTWINYYNPIAKVFVLNCAYTSSAGDRIMYEIATRK